MRMTLRPIAITSPLHICLTFIVNLLLYAPRVVGPCRLRTPREVGELSSPPNWHFERSQVRLGPWFVGKTGPAAGRRLTWRRSFADFTQLMRSAEESGVTRGRSFFGTRE